MAEDKFPLWTRKQAKRELKLRKIVKRAPSHTQLRAYSWMTKLSPTRPNTTFYTGDDGLVAAKQLDREVWFPNPIPFVNLSHVAVRYVEHLRGKYSLPGFTGVAPGDIVVDCGAFVGGFSLGVAATASEIHAFNLRQKI